MDSIHEISSLEFDKGLMNMITFQRIHNELRKDFQIIYELAKSKIEEVEVAKPLIRSSYKELFTLIEADIYLLNQFNPYEKHKDRDDFCKKFKQTFKHHSSTFNKQNINLEFNSTTFELLLKHKAKRDGFTHPKEKKSIQVSGINLDEIFELYKKYDAFINELMRNIGISKK